MCFSEEVGWKTIHCSFSSFNGSTLQLPTMFPTSSARDWEAVLFLVTSLLLWPLCKMPVQIPYFLKKLLYYGVGTYF
jgi:hypothetical protein